MNEASGPAVAAVAQDEITLANAASRYLDAYDGRDENRPLRLNAWVRLMGDKPLTGITSDDIDDGLKRLADEPARVYANKNADANRIYRKKGTGRRSNATVNRYFVAICALFSWARKTWPCPLMP